MKENTDDAYRQSFDEMMFKRFFVTLKATENVFQDERRRKYICTSVAPLTYKTYLAHLQNKVFKLRHCYGEDVNTN
ncbi:uncharacterized protein LOC143906545 isoform X3 [Temnothorax americanus]|uniref:uncharacterized protein LOC143906545 isoform X3 n=1 Tax=Temnothorax americanus TaxID=1964332 RepID=UPI004068B647